MYLVLDWLFSSQGNHANNYLNYVRAKNHTMHPICLYVYMWIFCQFLQFAIHVTSINTHRHVCIVIQCKEGAVPLNILKFLKCQKKSFLHAIHTYIREMIRMTDRPKQKYNRGRITIRYSLSIRLLYIHLSTVNQLTTISRTCTQCL